MAFKFGLIQSIDPTITLICFIVVVAFIIFFEHATEVLEYLLEENQMYSKIVQVIYKELMLMGVISFSIIMYQASKTGESSESESTIIVAIDFAHIILFYMTIFFVVHAIYLIRISIYNHRRNRGHFARSIKSLVEQIEARERKPWWHPARLAFHSDLLLLSSLRNKAEFKIVQTIFQALYLVPRNFNYPAYISGCYERYALKTTNRSLVSWFILLLAILVNYLRLFIGYNCTIHHYGGSSHRLLGGSSSDSSTSADAHEIQREDDLCRKLTMREFLVVGAMITAYNLCVLIASRVYKLRLVQFSGIKTSGDILGYLKYLDSFEEDFKKEIKATKRFTTKQLLSEIETTLNEMEHDEEEETVRLLASAVTHSFAHLRSAVGAVRYNLRLLLVSVFCPKRRRQKLLRRQTSVLLSDNGSPARKTNKLTRTAEMHHGLSNVSPAELECVATASPECLAAVVQQGGDFAAVCPQRKAQATADEDSDAGSKAAAPSGSQRALWPAWLPALWTLPRAHDSGRPPAALEGSSARTFRLYRHKSTLLTMMREQRPFAAIQQRVCVHMDEDLPLATLGLHRPRAADALSPTAASAADGEHRLAPDDDGDDDASNGDDDDVDGGGAGAIDARPAEATAHGPQQMAQLHGAALSSSTNSSSDALYATKTPTHRQPLSEAKQRRLRAAAASFYYQQRMTNWLVEQQQLGGRVAEADDDVASDESDSGDNSSPRDDSDGDDYGDVVADDPSVAPHSPRVFAAALQPQHAPPVTVMHAAAHHIAPASDPVALAPPLRLPPPIDVAALPPTATSARSSSRRTQLSGASVGHSSVGRHSAPHSPSGVSHRSAAPSVGSAQSPSRQKRLCAVRSYREMVKASEEAKEPPATLADDDLARLEEGTSGVKPTSGAESKAEDALLDELLHELGPLHPSGASAASGASGLKGSGSAALASPADHASEQAEADALQHASGRTVPEQFRGIFFLQRPELFFRAIELSIMFSCLFMALWVTNMISIVRDIDHATDAFVALGEVAMIVPILLHFYTLPSITETCALITALYQLDLHVAKDVLGDAVETSRLVKTVRRKILARTAHQVMLAERMQRDVRDEIQRRELDHQVHRLLHLDQDIARLRHVHDKRALLVKRLHRRLHQLQTGGGHAAHVSAEVHAKLKALHDELATEAKRLRHVTKKLATAQDERARAWREFETLKEAIDNTDLEQRRRFIDDLFEEMDQDGSGAIDRDEFREMLRQLQLTLSDHKFRLLFRAIDSVNGDGSIQREELHNFLFPPASVMLLDEAREARRRAELTGDENDAGHSEQFYRYAAPGSPAVTPQSRAALGLHQRKPPSHANDRDLGIDVTVKTPKRGARGHSATRHDAHDAHDAHHAPHHRRTSNVAVGKHAHSHTAAHRPQTAAAQRKAKKDRHARDGDLSSHSSDSSDY